ncbi:hypothetical protein NQ315_007726 [Exocentrus adspersus]|uniref:Proteasome inhibitor PI31 subunit n=1 Tax=Exocentrus adspersus TaxID=1586481 RepID=A0AAV8W8D4_9CUCU|nr:hypothetical protein NQ315_007726 [Exocentrus adspersus]
MATSLFGWDLLYSSVESDVKNNQDILVCLAHLVLVSNGFKCIGLGESKNIDGTESKSEALPKGWNENYAIRYVYQGRLYNFKATSLDDGVMLNLIRADERTVSLLQLNTRSVAQRTGTLDEMIPDNKNIVDLIKKQLIDKVVVSKKSREVSSQTDQEPAWNHPRGSIPVPPMRPINPRGSFDPLGVPPNYGRSDLDPFGGGVDPLRIPNPLMPPGGGGMLYQPPRLPPYPGVIPGVAPGSVPPGARFDPFRPPPDVDRFPVPGAPRRPDSDEFPPPGYDDMFM